MGYDAIGRSGRFGYTLLEPAIAMTVQSPETRAPRPTPAETTALVLLSYDEREALERLLPLIPFDLFDRVLAIDPGSTDGTLDLYEANGIPVVIQKKRGRGNAFILASEIVETDRIVFFSADGNENPEDLSVILGFLDDGYDLVIGGRFVREGAASDNSDDPLRLRRAGSMGFSVIVRLIWGCDVWDSCNGFRGLRRDAMKRMCLDAPSHEIEIQTTIRAAKLGMKIKEFPTRELLRMGGWRKKTAGTWSLGWQTGRCIAREIFMGRRFDDRDL